MIGFNALGQMGRLGNQMFQFASLKGIARNNGYEYCIPPTRNQNEWTDHQLFNPFKLKKTTQLNVQYIDSKRPVVSESDFSFDKNLFEKCPDWIDLRGFFQSEKYFKHIRDELLEDFEFRDEILEPAKKTISYWKNPIALHIRRTDYLTNPDHTTLSLDYYEKALTHFDSGAEILIFSDEPQWCMNQKLFDNDRFMISETMNPYMDLCLMSLCSGHIIANSSFSWWGAWLSANTSVVAPSGWFSGSRNEHLNTVDLIPETWTVI
jgi:hypothetical protein